MLRLGRLPAEHLVHEVVHHIPIITGKIPDESRTVFLLIQGEGHEVQAGNPPFGPLREHLDVGLGEIQRHHLVEERRCFGPRESQISRA